MRHSEYVYNVLLSGGYIVLHSYAGVAEWSLYDPSQLHEKYVRLTNLPTLIQWYIDKGTRILSHEVHERGSYMKYYFIEGYVEVDSL